MLITILIVLTVFYAIIIINLFRGLFFLKIGENKIRYFISIVVAARNEEKNISACLEALVHQTYPDDKFEIIIVDDRSEDNTAEIVRQYMAAHENVRLIQVKELPPEFAPKKHALSLGIDAAKGDIILTTDADCVPAPSWVEAMNSYFEPNVGLVAGFSPLEKKGKTTLFSGLVTLDSLSLAAVAAGSFGMSKPATCNGRNLGYRKQAFQEVNGFEEIKYYISGDDDLFLHLITSRTNWKTRYAFDKNALVKSQVPANFKQFSNQRIRHASKGFHYKSWFTLLLTVIYLFNLLLVILLPVSVLLSNFFIYWLSCFLVKSISEFLLMYKFAREFEYTYLFKLFPIAAILHPIYVVVFGFWGQFGKFKWKESSYSTEIAN